MHPDDRVASLAIWHAGSGKLSAQIQDLGTGSARFYPLAFSSDGRLVAVSTPDGRDLVIDPLTAQTRRTLRPIGGEYTASLAFAPDGTLATGTLSGIVQLWNPISGAQIGGPLPVSAGPVSGIAFDHSGQRFATAASQDGTVKVFAASTLQQEGTTLNTNQRVASTAAFEPHGNSLLVVNDDGSGFTWPMSVTVWEQRACGIAGRNLTPQEWSRYLPGQAHRRVCP